MRNLINLFVVAILLTGCGTLGTIKRTNDLMPGMTMSEVKKVMGQPSQTQFVGDKLVLKYNLHQYYKGWVPYYLAFDRDTNKLAVWFADEQEYYRNQQLWLEAMPKQVNVNENINVSGNINENVHHDVKGDIRHDVYVK
ncbi:MAG: outer membrane protein assembly factor BamE [Candidatus Omnitrophota bacterium]